MIKDILLRFNHKDDYHCVWLREQWLLKRFSIRVFKWTPDFRLDVESSIAPVWVSFPLLPVQFFDKQSLFPIASALGAPMKADAATATLVRPSVAKVCVEMDLLKKFPNRVWIGCGDSGFWQLVQYEKVPMYCTKCMKQRHEKAQCKMKDSTRSGQNDTKESAVAGIKQGDAIVGNEEMKEDHAVWGQNKEIK